MSTIARINIYKYVHTYISAYVCSTECPNDIHSNVMEMSAQRRYFICGVRPFERPTSVRLSIISLLLPLKSFCSDADMTKRVCTQTHADVVAVVVIIHILSVILWTNISLPRIFHPHLGFKDSFKGLESVCWMLGDLTACIPIVWCRVRVNTARDTCDLVGIRRVFRLSWPNGSCERNTSRYLSSLSQASVTSIGAEVDNQPPSHNPIRFLPEHINCAVTSDSVVTLYLIKPHQNTVMHFWEQI